MNDLRLQNSWDFIQNNYFHNLKGVLALCPTHFDKIKMVFVGISEEIMSQNIFLGHLGEFPEHTFNETDLDNLRIWVGFQNKKVLPLEDVLQSEYLKSLCHI